MGTLNYGGWAVEFDDRVLTHLQIVIVNRLRRGEPVLVSWIDSLSVGDGRSSIWITNATPMYFKFNGSRTPAIDRDWIARLDASATSPTGLLVTDAEGVLIRATNAELPHHGIPQPNIHLPRR